MTDSPENAQDTSAATYQSFEIDYGAETPSTAIITAIATIENEPAADLDIILHESIDPEALDSFFDEPPRADPENTTTVEFQIDRYTVRVRADGSITLAYPE